MSAGEAISGSEGMEVYIIIFSSSEMVLVLR